MSAQRGGREDWIELRNIALKVDGLIAFLGLIALIVGAH